MCVAAFAFGPGVGIASAGCTTVVTGPPVYSGDGVPLTKSYRAYGKDAYAACTTVNNNQYDMGEVVEILDPTIPVWTPMDGGPIHASYRENNATFYNTQANVHYHRSC